MVKLPAIGWGQHLDVSFTTKSKSRLRRCLILPQCLRNFVVSGISWGAFPVLQGFRSLGSKCKLLPIYFRLLCSPKHLRRLQNVFVHHQKFFDILQVFREIFFQCQCRDSGVATVLFSLIAMDERLGLVICWNNFVGLEVSVSIDVMQGPEEFTLLSHGPQLWWLGIAGFVQFTYHEIRLVLFTP